MANRGRDLELSIISDANQFDLDKPATDLDHLGDAATTTAKRVDSAFDKIRQSSRTNMRAVDADIDKGKRGLDEFKGEAHSSGKEAAASFGGGFTDVADFVQETAANAFQGFGKLGGAAGLAAAAGIGILTASITAAQEKINDLRDGLTDLFQSAEASPRAKLQQFFDTYKDDLPQIRKELQDAGISQRDYFDAIAQGGPKLDNVKARLSAYYDTQGAFEHRIGHTINVTNDWVNVLQEAATAGQSNADALGRQADNADHAADRTAAFTTALSGSLKSVADDATDMTDAIAGGIDKVIAAQARQLSAQVDYEKNTKKVFAKLGQAAVDWALAQGDNADEAMQLLANAPKAKGKAVVDQWKKLGKNSGEAHATQLADALGSPAPAAAASAQGRRVRAALADALGGSIPAPTVDFTIARRLATEQARRIRAEISDAMTTPAPSRSYPGG